MNFPQHLLSCLNSPSWYVKAGKTKKKGNFLVYIFLSPSSLLPNPPAPTPTSSWLDIHSIYLSSWSSFFFSFFFFFFFFTNQTMKSLLNYMIRVLLSFFLIFCDSSTATVSFQEWPETRSCCH